VGGEIAFCGPFCIQGDIGFKYYLTFFPETKYLGNYIEESGCRKDVASFERGFITEGTDIYVMYN
jgi:hypothetical protein